MKVLASVAVLALAAGLGEKDTSIVFTLIERLAALR